MCYFLVDTYINDAKGRGLYDDYILKVKPIVESYGGEYLLRSEKVSSLHEVNETNTVNGTHKLNETHKVNENQFDRKPNRVIVIRFPSKAKLIECFQSEEYKAIMNKRIESVDAKAVIVEE